MLATTTRGLLAGALAVERYEFWKAGISVTLSAPVGSDSVGPRRTVTDSFKWTP